MSQTSTRTANPETVTGPDLPQTYSSVVDAISTKHKELIGRVLGKRSLASLPLKQVLNQFVQSQEGRAAGCTGQMHPSEIVFLAAVEDLVKRAAKTGVSPERVRAYARFLAYAQALEDGENVDVDHAFRALRATVGDLHGLRDGYDEPNKAEKEYRQGRKALQFVHSSTHSAGIAVRRLHSVLTRHRSKLPQHIRDSFPPEKIQMILGTLNNLSKATEPFEDYLKANERLCRSGFNATKQAYIWWQHHGPANRGRWNDMHAVARAWRLTGSKDVETFRRYVRLKSHGLASTRAWPPGFAR